MKDNTNNENWKNKIQNQYDTCHEYVSQSVQIKAIQVNRLSSIKLFLPYKQEFATPWHIYLKVMIIGQISPHRKGSLRDISYTTLDGSSLLNGI